MVAVILTEPLDTLSRKWPAGSEFEAEIFESAGVATLRDAAGVKRVSDCPVERFRPRDGEHTRCQQSEISASSVGSDLGSLKVIPSHLPPVEIALTDSSDHGQSAKTAGELSALEITFASTIRSDVASASSEQLVERIDLSERCTSGESRGITSQMTTHDDSHRTVRSHHLPVLSGVHSSGETEDGRSEQRKNTQHGQHMPMDREAEAPQNSREDSGRNPPDAGRRGVLQQPAKEPRGSDRSLGQSGELERCQQVAGPDRSVPELRNRMGRADEVARQVAPTQVTRSLMPCDYCGYFQSGGTQCRCGAVLSFTTDVLGQEPNLPSSVPLCLRGESSGSEECPFEPTSIDRVNAELAAAPRSTDADSSVSARFAVASSDYTSEPSLTPNEAVDITTPDGCRLIVIPGRIRPLVTRIQPELYYVPEKLRAYNERWHANVRRRWAELGIEYGTGRKTTPGENDAQTVSDGAESSMEVRPSDLPIDWVQVAQPESEAVRGLLCADAARSPSRSEVIGRISSESGDLFPARMPATVCHRRIASGEYPEPGDWMNRLERAGWRYVDGVARFGADRPEELPAWREWLARVFVATESAVA